MIHGDAQRPAGFAQAPVLVGIDGSAASESATAIAFDEAPWRGVDLVALHAWCDADWPEFPVMEASAIEAAAEDVLAERLAGWQERYPEVTVRRVVVFQRCSSDEAFVTGSDRPVPPPSQTTTRASCDSCSPLVTAVQRRHPKDVNDFAIVDAAQDCGNPSHRRRDYLPG